MTVPGPERASRWPAKTVHVHVHGRGRAAVVALLLLSCGYRFTAPGSALPDGIQRVRAPVFANATAEPGAEGLFTQALREELLRAGRLGGDGDEAVLEGKVLAVSSSPLSPNRPPTYRLTASVSLTLRRGERQLSALTVTGSEDYPSGADVLWSETNRGAALRRLAASLMRQGLERLASGPG